MSRDLIIQTIKNNKPDNTDLPDLPASKDDGEILAQFQKAVRNAGGTSQIIDQQNSIADFMHDNYPTAENLFADKDEYGIPSSPPGQIRHPGDYQNIDVAVISGELAVAENGAIWVTDRSLKYRSVLFLAQHLIIVIQEHMLVSDMMTAYRQLISPDSGFGCFISGPSKTADIEQALVIGAHGPKSLCVLIR